MKRLFLLRHASAVPTAPGGDRERPLSEAGRGEAAVMSSVVAGMSRRPDHALVSSARRTRETWEGLRLPGTPVTFADAIYDAEAETLLDLVRGAPDGADALMLVGHNPGVSDLGEALSGSAEATLVPAGLLVIDLAADRWRDVVTGCGTVCDRLSPASVAEAGG